jgi:hypothetical protein
VTLPATTAATPSPIAAPRKRRVQIGERVFYVGRMPDGRPRNIMEFRAGNGRRSSNTYWHHRRPIGGPNTLVRRILHEAGIDTRQITGH